MIQIYRSGNEDFQHNGDVVLHCYSCELEAQLNGSWVLNLEAPIDDEGRWKLVTEEAVLKVPTWQDDEQLYRISKVTMTDDGVSAIAYPIFYDSANDCFLMDVRPTGKTGQEALDMMTVRSPYGGRSDITSTNTAYFVRRNLMDAINGSESPTFIERWGGEILYDNYDIVINERVGGDYGMEARYGRNMNGVSYIVDNAEVVTRIVPIAYNGHMMSGEEPWVDSPNIDKYAKVYTKEVRYENIRLKADAGSGENLIICNDQAELDTALREAAEADFASGMDTPTVTIDIDMVVIKQMANTYQDVLLDANGQKIQDNNNEDILTAWYRDYSSLETVRLGDTVRCRHYKLDITTTARVIAMTWDCVRQCVTHVTLGDYQYDYVKAVSGAINRIAKAIRADGSLVAERVQGYLNGATTQLRTQYNMAEKQDVIAILFENMDESSPMYGALGIGTQGISISKTRTEDGRDWDWTTGITANGMNADIGIFGLLSDKLGRNWWNMDTGEFHMSSESTIGGKTIDGYMEEAGDALADYVRKNDAVIAQIQNQIDGQYDTYFEDYDPTLANLPASEWTDEATKAEHEGDLFYNKANGASYRFFKNETTGAWEWTLITDTVAAQAMQVASQARDTADGKRRVFITVPTPPYDPGDLYFTGQVILVCTTAKAQGGTYATTDFVRLDAYNTASAFNEFLAEYSQTIEGLQSDVDDRIETWPQKTDPSDSWTESEKAYHAGDIWYNTDKGTMHYWTGTEWASMTTNPPTSVLDSISAKATVFVTEPKPPYKVGDLWFDSATADIMTCTTGRESGNFNANDWQKRNKYTDDSALDTYKVEVSGIVDDLQGQVDDKIQTFYQSTDPAAAWTEIRTDHLQDHLGNDIVDEDSEEIATAYEYGKSIHKGDLWYNTADGTQWRWNGGSWEQVTIPDALMDTIDGKKSIYTTQPVPPYEQCDLWVQGETGDILVCTVGRAASETFRLSDWSLASKYTDDSALNAWIAGDFAATIQEIREQSDGKAETWYQEADPSLMWETDDDKALHRGDLWYRTTDQTTWFWGGRDWQAQNIPLDVFDTIDTKAQIFATQPTTPYFENDLWYTGTVVKICTRTRKEGSFNASDWEKKDYYTDDSALSAFISGEFARLKQSSSEKIETWYQNNDPSTAWNTATLKAEHNGDLWYNTASGQQRLYRWDGTNWQEAKAEPPQSVQDVINAKANIFIGNATPSNPKAGDLWLKSASDDILTYTGRKWEKFNKYTDDSALNTFINGSYKDTIEAVKTQTDGKAETWAQEEDPAKNWTDKPSHAGDIWYCTKSDVQKSYIYDGTDWNEMKTAPPDGIIDVIDGKAQVFATEPKPPYYKNDLWFTGTEIKVCTVDRETGSYAAADWVKKDSYTDDSALTTWLTNTYAADLKAINSSIDGKIETWYQNSDPATSWSKDEKAKHTGDIWHNTDSQKTYRYESGVWLEMTSNPPGAVFDRIDGKAQIFTDTPTTPYHIGDLWYTSDGIVKVCTKARTDKESYTAVDWTKKDKYTDDSALTAFIEGSYNQTIAEITSQADGKAETWYQKDDPSAEWNTDALKAAHKGDLWYRTDTQETHYWDGTSWQKQDVPTAVFDKIDSKAQIFASEPTTPYYKNDLYYTGTSVMVCTNTRLTGSYTKSDWAKKDNYTDDSALTTWINGEYKTTLAELQTQTDQKAEIWYQTNDPSADWDTTAEQTLHKGDIWWNGTKYQIYNGINWNDMKITPSDAYTNTINNQLNKKSSIFVGTTKPSLPEEGDLWFKGEEEGIYSYVNREWVVYNKYTDDASLIAFVNDTYMPKVIDLQTQIDGKTDIWFFEYAPKASVKPESDWTTDAEKAKHIGDLFYNMTPGSQACYRYVNYNSGYKWEQITDAAITQAMQAAQNAQGAADGKVTAYTVQPTPPYAVGDLWITDKGIKYCTQSNSGTVFLDSDWSDSPTDTKVNATIEALNGTIIAQVVQGNIINAINLSTEGVSISGSKININGVTSINSYFKVNTDGSFETIKGKIGSINIVEKAIYSGEHNAWNSEKVGFFFGSDGNFSVGDKDTYIRYNGNGTLDIKAKSITIAGTSVATTDVTSAIKKIVDQHTSDLTTVGGKADAAQTAADTAQGAADAAQTTANAAQIAAEGAAETATNFLYFDDTNGLIVSEVGTVDGNTQKPYNTQIKGAGIYFRSGTKNLSSMTADALTFYLPRSTKADVKMMEVKSDGMYFYKSTSATEPGAEVTAAKYTANGLEVASGKISGFTIDDNCIYIGTLGDSEANSVFISSGTKAYAQIGGSTNKSGWVFTAKNTFGVNLDGNVYISSGKIGGITIANSAIYTGEKKAVNNNTAGFYLGSDGQINIGNSTNYIKFIDGQLSLRATSILMGATGTDVETAVSNANTAASNAQSAATSASTAASNAQTAATDAQSTANGAQTAASNAQKTATSAQNTASSAYTTATSAKSTAESAQSTASSAYSTATSAAKTATNFLHVTSAGLVINNNESSTSTGYNVLIGSNSVQMRYGSVVRNEMTSAGYYIYRTVTSGNTTISRTAIGITSTAITLYKPDGSAGVTIDANGLTISSIAGMTVNASYLKYERPMNSTTSTYRAIGYFGEYSNRAIAIWVGDSLTSSYSGEYKFYVDYTGKMYAKNAEITGIVNATSGKIGTWIINATGLSNSTGSTYIYPSGISLSGTIYVRNSKSNTKVMISGSAPDGFSDYNLEVLGPAFLEQGFTCTASNLTTYAHTNTNVSYLLGLNSKGKLIKINRF